jgi:restriction system protein
VRAAYRGAHPERPDSHVNTQAAQLWAFGHRMEIGDPVVVPFLGQPEIAIGEIRGPYTWLGDAEPDMPHVRDVTWHVVDMPRIAFDPDLRYSFGGSVTVCSVRRNDAERRVRSMLR